MLICHLYPDLMNLYGDTGNVDVLRSRCVRRGIGVEVARCGVGDAIPDGVDLLFVGGGQDFDQEIVGRDLSGGKSDAIRRLVDGGAAVLAICGGYQMLGSYYVGADGARTPGIGAIPVHTVNGHGRLVGDTLVETSVTGVPAKVVGFENHGGRTYLDGAEPFGHVLHGHGNNGEDGTEGVIWHNVIGTYSHGPFLPRNPGIADWLVARALGHAGEDAELAPLDDGIAAMAREQMIRRLS